jgi:hypothetical protein
MINFVTIEGAAGFLRKRPLARQFKRLLKCRGKQKNVETHYLLCSVFPILRGIRLRRIRKALLKYSSRGHVLILAGKSLGAIWSLRMLDDLKLEYSRIYLCTIDPHDPLDQPADSYKTKGRFTKGVNVYQANEWPEGAPVESQISPVENIGIGNPEIDHWNITFSKYSVDVICKTIASALEN